MKHDETTSSFFGFLKSWGIPHHGSHACSHCSHRPQSSSACFSASAMAASSFWKVMPIALENCPCHQENGWSIYHHISMYISMFLEWLANVISQIQKKRLDVAWARSVDRTCQNRGSSRRREIWRRCKQCTSASKWIDPTDPEFYEKVCRKPLHLRVVKHVRPHPRGKKKKKTHTHTVPRSEWWWWWWW